MSENAERKPLDEARILAEEVKVLLENVVDRMLIAGSIRRSKSDVGDIEIVVQVSDNRIDVLCDSLIGQGVLTKRHKSNGALLSWAQRFKAAYYKGFPLDIFIVRPDRQWGATLLIRTGPGAANEVLVTHKGRMNRHGLLGVLPTNMLFKDGQVLRNGVALDLPEEVDVFNACGLPYIAPGERTDLTYQRLAGTFTPPEPTPGKSQSGADSSTSASGLLIDMPASDPKWDVANRMKVFYHYDDLDIEGELAKFRRLSAQFAAERAVSDAAWVAQWDAAA